MATETRTMIDLAAEIVAAYVSNNEVAADNLPALIQKVFATISSVGDAAAPAKMPAVNWQETITPDYLVCLEDGQEYKSLKRHLKAAYNMTPDEYRQKWGLPNDYPMVSPNYAESRSHLAKKIGLGHYAGEGRRRKQHEDA